MPKLNLNKALFNRLVIIILALLAYAFIAIRLLHFEHWSTLGNVLSYKNLNFWYLGLLTVLFVFNVFTASKQWQVLIAPYLKLDITKAIRQYLAGCLSAIGSPARLAEPGGRMVLLPKEHRLNAVIMTTVGGMIQNMIIFLFGILVLIFFQANLIRLDNIKLFTDNRIYFALLISVIVILFVIFKRFIFRNSKVRYWILKLKKLRLLVWSKAFFWTSLRYLIYNFQLFVCFKLFGLDIHFFDFILYSPIYFLFITLIPSFFLADLGIRGSVSLFVFNHYEAQMPLILLAIFSLWLINVVVPALLGTIILSTNSYGKRRYSDGKV
ncbi:hypothetical protein [Carboxylicivirga sp. N1Y90]|uniref:hypothetical protein n=1 Tax=Carboxylicivirga fragile TaxID=3417571 RepID=UPI003D33F3BF|nr:flippase-like domain-containing protein [Marinilabiliaceae bacterium N1Y90]